MQVDSGPRGSVGTLAPLLSRHFIPVSWPMDAPDHIRSDAVVIVGFAIAERHFSLQKRPIPGQRVVASVSCRLLPGRAGIDGVRAGPE